MTENKENKDIDKMSFEQAITELTSIVERIELGEIPLQESIEQYEKGMALIKHCRIYPGKGGEKNRKDTRAKNRRKT